VIEVINQTSQVVGNVQLGVQASPNTPQRVQTIRQTIRPGQRHVIDTGSRMTQAQANQIKVVILRADVAS